MAFNRAIGKNNAHKRQKTQRTEFKEENENHRTQENPARNKQILGKKNKTIKKSEIEGPNRERKDRKWENERMRAQRNKDSQL